ncbi:flavin reductase family protein [Streptomyces sp. OF3]|uniref:Flavin reductase family protein n=1 Tax=Streptomyces alkaliterrae TaxID=2213162 RepID=A0A7W3ZLB7_9ACTN|nr:flavin reductase [Streptomyces alkaliterrae]MBB1252598.1 flavin reductase family protein [Streptomyces alkaliterrae]
MSLVIPEQLWKKATSTIGLVVVRHDDGVNVMAAEWSYFVNKEPLYAAVVLSPRARTRELLPKQGEFSLTLCSEEQAELADFVGSFSLDEVDKTGSELIGFGAPETTETPWVEGGLVALECVLRESIPFPVHTMFVGEVVAAHLPGRERRPLVKHGSMHALGKPVRRTAVVATAQVLPDGTLRVAATGPVASGSDVWRLSLLGADGGTTELGEHPSAEWGDFQADLPLPAGPPTLAGARIKVEREGAIPGFARVTVGGGAHT